MSDLERSPEVVVGRLPGTRRLRLVSAYFALYGLSAAAVTVGAITTVLIPRLGWHTTPSGPWIVIPGLALLTFAFLRARHLLRQRRKAGALLATLCLASSVAVAAHAHDFGWRALAIPLLGLGLLASLWPHLD